MAVPICHVLNLGTMDYMQAWELQRSLVAHIQQGAQPNAVLLLEHPHVYTLGRRGTRQEVLLDDDALAQRGIALYETDRGGQVTYHGPGQLVAYPVIDLRGWGGPVKYVRTLEQVMVTTLASFGIEAGLKEGITGVWVGDAKIGAIGVKISGGVAHHGLALNVNTDLTYFDDIVPCGMAGVTVTSMQQLLNEPVDMEMVSYSLVYHFGRLMALRMKAGQSLPQELLSLAGSAS